MATRKRHQAQNSKAARVRAAAAHKIPSVRKAANTHPRAVALAVTTAFVPWFVPFTVYAQAPAPNTTPTLELTSKPDTGYVHPAQGSYLQIDQYKDRASFAGTVQLGSASHMNVTQPNSAAVALFVDTSGQTSQIWGRVTANGQLFFTNSAGVLFGRTASVSAAGIVATTLSVNEKDFLDEKNPHIRLENLGATGKVENYGKLVTANGYTGLIGPQVINDGVIIAQRGTVTLAAADRVSLDLIGDGLISINVEQAAMNASVLNSGSIEADGGRVLLTARSANALLDTVINSTGIIRANSLVERNGEIVLDGGSAGVVSVSGRLEAAGKDVGTHGGTVKVLGKYVGLVGEAKVDVSGDAGGGTALIGGNFQGKGPEQNATATFVGRNASINADARGDGDGGTAIVWSDEVTRVYGTISARGGARGGDGGFIETSGKDFLELIGATVDASSPLGRAGTWLLDPRNVTIANAAGDPFFDGGSPNVFTPTADGAIADRNTIEASLNGGTSVTVNTGSTGAQDGDITVQDSITKSAGGDATLLLTAGDDIFVNAAITSTAGRLHVALTANDDATAGGSVSVAQTITTNGGNFTASGVAFTATAGINTSGADGAANTAGANGGAVLITATDGNITTSGTTIQTTGGDAGAPVVAAGLAGGNAGGVTLQVTSATAARVISTGTVTANGGIGSDATAAGNGGAGGAGGTVTMTGDAGGFGASLTASGAIDTTGGAGGAAGLSGTGGVGGVGGGVAISIAQAASLNNSVTTSGGAGGGIGLGTAAGAGGNGGSVSVTSTASSVQVGGIITTGAGAAAAAATISAATNINLNASINAGTKTVSFLIGQNGSGGTLVIPAAVNITAGTISLTGGSGPDTINVTRDTDMTLTNASLAISGAYTIGLTSVESAVLTGGGTGNNINASAFTAGAVTLDGQDGNDTLSGGSGNDTIIAGTGDDSISGGDGNDSIRFTNGNLTLADTVNGGLGTNEIRITDDAMLVDADFTNVSTVQTLFLAGTGSQNVTLATEAEQAGIVTVDASAGNASTINASGYVTAGISITTNAGADTISSGAGDDTISSGLAADVIASGAGNDSIAAGDGDDSIRFADANFTSADTVDGGLGTNEIRITDAAAVVDADFTSVTNVQTLFLAADAAQSATLGSFSDAAGIVTVDATSATTGTSNVTVDASGRANAITINTGAGADTITGGAGLDNISAGDGNDSIRFTNARFVAGETVDGGNGTDEIRIIDAATITDAQFANKTLVETLFLQADAAQSVTLAGNSDTAGIVTVDASSSLTATSNITVNAGGRTNGIAITTGAGADTITGGAGADSIVAGAGNDSIQFANANFTSADTVDGGLGANEIRITDAAAVVDADFTSVTSVQTLVLAADAAESATLGSFSDAAGIVTVDATSATTGTSNVTLDASGRANAMTISTGAGADTITGSAGLDNISAGDGNDSIRFTNARFVAGETVDGGNGTDEMRIADAATITDAQFANKTLVETLVLAADAAQSATLAAGAQAAGIVTVDATSATAGTSNVTVDASAYTVAITINTGAGADTITGGAAADNISAGDGNDSIRFTNARFVAGETVDGGNGTDEIRIIDAATITDAQFANKTLVETLFLQADATQSVTLAGNSDSAGIVVVDATSAVTGTSNITVDASGRTNAIAISTGAGADTITGGAGLDNISAGDGNDSIRFTNARFVGGETVNGGNGTDEIRITDAANITDAQFANKSNAETLFLAADATQSVTLAGNSDTAGIVTVDATSAVTGTSNITVNAGGRANAIAITTGAGADTITGGGGADNIVAGAGNDSIRFADANFTSADTVVGGGGANEIRITDAAGVVDADFTNVTNVQTLFLAADAAQSATLGTFSDAAGVVTVDATSATTGTSNVTVDASGRANAITISMGAGADTITGGAGLDNISAGDGNDSIRFTNARFVAGETVNGGNGTDEIHITDAATITDAPFANKTLVETLFLAADAAHSATLAANAQAAGIVTLDATSATTATSNVTVDASAYTVAITISTGAGADTITGGAAADNISAGDGNDSIHYTNARFVAGETVDGGNGSDEIRITDAATITDAQFANKTLVETLLLQADAVQSVTLAGNSDTAGIVTLDATSAVTGTSNITADASGRANAITISTGAGADTITGGAAADNISAGDGNDSIRFTNARFVAGETVDGGSGTDEIRITDAATITDAQFANKSNAETLFLQADATQSVTLAGNSDTAGIVTVDASSAVTATSNVTVNAGGRADAIEITTGAGADTITGGGGADNIVAGAGNDSIRFADVNFTSADTVVGGAGANEIRIADAAGVVDADFTNVTNVQMLFLAADATQSATLGAAAQAAGVVTVDATSAVTGTSNVTVNASAYTAAITVSSGAGADVLTGGAGNDTLNAGNGNDTLTGGAGADALNGGGGANVVTETRDANFVLTDTTLAIGAEGTDTLTGIGTANLTGGASANSFTVSGWTGLGTMDGLGNTDTIVASNDVNFTLANTSLARSGGAQTLTLANMESATLTGGGGANAFVLSGWTGSGSMTGNGSTDTLTGPDTANTWNVTGAGSGNINSLVNFSGFTNLAGGTAADNFVLGNGVVLAGTLSGGTGSDTLNLSGYAATTHVSLTVSAAGGYSGTTSAVSGGFDTIDVVSGSASANNTLTGMNAPSTWTSTGTNSGTYTTGGNTLAFSNFRNWTAGNGADTFTGANISGNLADGGGATSLGGTITTGGTQNYLGAVTLIGDTVANSAGITFNSTLDGGFNFTSNNAATNTFMGVIGGATALASITTDAPGLSVLGGNVTVTGAINFLDVTTANGITMTSTGGGAVTVNGANASSPAFVNTTGSVTFQGTTVGTAGTPLVFIVTPTALTLTQQATAFFSGPALPGSMVFPNGSSVSFNNAQISQSFLQQQATTAASNASQAVTAAIVEEANKTFGTDSVAEDVEYGFAGEVGTTPPMDHRIDESGISVPRCVQESREGVPCK